jgi:hypothetical protein
MRKRCVVKKIAWILTVGALGMLAQRLNAEEPTTPELVASLFPADGFIPVNPAEHLVYRFQVIAQEVDESGKMKMKGDAIVAKAMVNTLVEPGQTRNISSPQNSEWRLDGAVTIRLDGFVTYHVCLLHKGERVTSTSAGMNLKNGE